MFGTRRTVITGFALLAAGLMAPAFAQETATTPAPETPAITVPDMTLGDENAPLTIVEYASFTCPHCAAFHAEGFPNLKADFIDTGKVKFIYREVYFDKYGMWASLIARCAGPEKFFGIADLVYNTQSTWVRAGGDLEIVNELSKIGRMAGLEGEQIQACLQDGDQLRALVGWYQENVTRDAVEGTPTFIIDGEKVTNRPYAELKTLIDEKLAAK